MAASWKPLVASPRNIPIFSTTIWLSITPACSWYRTHISLMFSWPQICTVRSLQMWFAVSSEALAYSREETTANTTQFSSLEPETLAHQLPARILQIHLQCWTQAWICWTISATISTQTPLLMPFIRQLLQTRFIQLVSLKNIEWNARILKHSNFFRLGRNRIINWCHSECLEALGWQTHLLVSLSLTFAFNLWLECFK